MSDDASICGSAALGPASTYDDVGASVASPEGRWRKRAVRVEGPRTFFHLRQGRLLVV